MRRHRRGRRRAEPLRETGPAERGHLVELLETMRSRLETGPRLTGGDVDADWAGAASSGNEAVGGSVATPDQDIVDELGRALGVEQDSDAEFRTSGEILAERDRRRWWLEDDEEEDDSPRGLRRRDRRPRP